MIALRPPRDDEGDALTELCLRSKAVHGYDAAFIEMCRAELTVCIGKPGHVFIVAERNGELAGMAEISVNGEEAELEKIFVEPAAIGSGVGRRLFSWARCEAAALGCSYMMIDAEPGAAPFYRAMGAGEVGQSPSGSIPGRVLPRYRFALAGISA
ncbi:MAG: GNAT family N-acetyltransferase [Rhizobiaceae bacterium]